MGVNSRCNFYRMPLCCLFGNVQSTEDKRAIAGSVITESNQARDIEIGQCAIAAGCCYLITGHAGYDC